mgnify:FL=1
MLIEELQQELDKIVSKHEAFLRRYPGGEIADLRQRDLRAVRLPGVDLRQALLAGANLQNSVFAGANLSDARC